MTDKQRDPKHVAPEEPKSGKHGSESNEEHQLERPSVKPDDDFGGEKSDKHKSGQNQKR